MIKKVGQITVHSESIVSDKNREEFISKHLDKLEKTIEKVDEKCDNIDKSVALFGQRFEEHLKQDELMYNEFKRMVDILQDNTNDIKHHIARTDALQSLVTSINERLTPFEQDKLKKEAVREFMMERSVKWGKRIGIIGGILTVIYTILKITHGI